MIEDYEALALDSLEDLRFEIETLLAFAEEGDNKTGVDLGRIALALVDRLEGLD